MTEGPAATAADKGLGSWEPRTGRVGEHSQAVSAGDKLGKPRWTDTLRRHNAEDGDKLMGVAEETILPGWEVVERAHERWVPK